MFVVFARTGGKISAYSSRSHPRDCANPLGARSSRRFVLVSQSLDNLPRATQSRDISPLARMCCVKSILMRSNSDENNLAVVFMYRRNAKRIHSGCLLCSRESRVIPRCTR
ncbi:hypothetical protein ACFW04_000665 [Cataglyphis niger]